MSTFDDLKDCPSWPEDLAQRYRQAGFLRSHDVSLWLQSRLSSMGSCAK